MIKEVLTKLIKTKMELSDAVISVLPENIKSTVHSIRRNYIEAAQEAMSDYLKRSQDIPKKSNDIHQIEVE